MRASVLAVCFAAMLNAISMPNLALAQNLVLNGGFEEAPLVNPPLHWVGNGILFPFPHSGFNAAALVDSQIFDALGQSVATTPGGIYLVEFWLANPDFGEPPNNDLSVSFGDSGFTWVNAPFFNYTEFSFTARAQAAQTTLQFLGRNQSSAWIFDDVSVTAVVPEPSSFVLAAAGALVLAVRCSRRKRRQA